MNTMRMFAQITKVDAAKREVWGRLAHEVPDRAGEIFDYESSKPYFKAWSQEFADATDGKSLGNMRAMHGKVAAGKFTRIDFNDAEKAIDVCGVVVDDAEWKKVEAGVYTGFSIGGSYIGDKRAEKVDGKDYQRYTAKPAEGSLVDSPCIPTAKFFDIVKADGVVEQVAFQPPPIEVQGTDEEVAAFGKALNDHGLTMADAIELVKAGKPEAPAEPHALVKAAQEYVDAEAALAKEYEVTGDAFDAAMEKALTADEIAAVAKAAPGAMVKSLRAAAIAKGTGGHAQKIHDMLGEMGAKCAAKHDEAGDLTKNNDLQKALDSALERIGKLENQPVPYVTLRAVAKGAAPDQPTDPESLGVESLTPAEIVKHYDGTPDYETSLFQKRQKMRLAQARQ